MSIVDFFGCCPGALLIDTPQSPVPYSGGRPLAGPSHQNIPHPGRRTQTRERRYEDALTCTTRRAESPHSPGKRDHWHLEHIPRRAMYGFCTMTTCGAAEAPKSAAQGPQQAVAQPFEKQPQRDGSVAACWVPIQGTPSHPPFSLAAGGGGSIPKPHCPRWG
ncbi:hypothetical protein TCAP_04549 [Tolypocladium capitatum]|uniref:Uncharacterized protein n=1 Tax=Tolypocladium capitatum TaxID=45235 RepID=A0A2K3QDA9_9HYPO|nr:hypothetical protein TCAP_04549 [Tolypocladium capitatum]